MTSLDPEERALWARVIATVEPLKGREAPGRISSKPSIPSEVEGRAEGWAEPKPARGPGGASTALGMDGVGKGKGAAKTPPTPPANTLDGSWDRRLARGLVVPDLAVDLHGHTLDSAWRELDLGLAEAIARGARVLLLVTGKPRAPGSGRGAIRAAVGDWLAGSRHAAAIAAVRNAHPRHGGQGALYIVLRRPRSRIS